MARRPKNFDPKVKPPQQLGPSKDVLDPLKLGSEHKLSLRIDGQVALVRPSAREHKIDIQDLKFV
jgi:hypothetical protein